MTNHRMKDGRARRAPVLVVAALTLMGLLAVGRPAAAQTDPYTGGGVTVEVQVSPSISINITITGPNQRVRFQGCNFRPNALLRLTLNPGTLQNPGTPCPGAIIPNTNSTNALADVSQLQLIGAARVPLQQVQLQTTTKPRCPYNNPGEALAPDRTSDGTIALTNADQQGCVDTWLTVPNRPPGSYQLCAASAGAETVCAVLRLTGAESVTGRGFARTGIIILPLVIGALAAIFVGRRLTQRGKGRHSAAS